MLLHSVVMAFSSVLNWRGSLAFTPEEAAERRRSGGIQTAVAYHQLDLASLARPAVLFANLLRIGRPAERGGWARSLVILLFLRQPLPADPAGMVLSPASPVLAASPLVGWLQSLPPGVLPSET